MEGPDGVELVGDCDESAGELIEVEIAVGCFEVDSLVKVSVAARFGLFSP